MKEKKKHLLILLGGCKHIFVNFDSLWILVLSNSSKAKILTDWNWISILDFTIKSNFNISSKKKKNPASLLKASLFWKMLRIGSACFVTRSGAGGATRLLFFLKVIHTVSLTLFCCCYTSEKQIRGKIHITKGFKMRNRKRHIRSSHTGPRLAQIKESETVFHLIYIIKQRKMYFHTSKCGFVYLTSKNVNLHIFSLFLWLILSHH